MVKFSIYLNRRVFVMNRVTEDCVFCSGNLRDPDEISTSIQGSVAEMKFNEMIK